MRLLRAAVAAVLALACLGAAAQQPAPDAADLDEARKLFSAMRLEAQFDEMRRMVSGMVTGLAKPSNADARRVSEIAAEESMEAARDMLLKPGGLMDMMVRAYASRFSVEELRALRGFYESPIGTKFIAEQPNIARAAMPELMKAQKEMIATLCARMRTRLEAEGLKAPDCGAMR